MKLQILIPQYTEDEAIIKPLLDSIELQQSVELCLPDGSDNKESACNAGDVGSVPGSGRSPGGENGNPLQYSCLGIPWTEDPGGL